MITTFFVDDTFQQFLRRKLLSRQRKTRYILFTKPSATVSKKCCILCIYNWYPAQLHGVCNVKITVFVVMYNPRRRIALTHWGRVTRICHHSAWHESTKCFNMALSGHRGPVSIQSCSPTCIENSRVGSFPWWELVKHSCYLRMYFLRFRGWHIGSYI